jgi:putative hemolysin
MTAKTDHRGKLQPGDNMTPAGGTITEISRANYRVRLANDAADVRAAQLLRFIVFNLELREGLEQSYATCLDADAFDEVCDHLLVENLQTGEVVGTYRLQTGRTAAAKLGYYSAQEFDFTPYERFRDELLELGRACVHIQHRNLVVLSLLWKGIAAYAARCGCRYLIGCSSLTSQDPSAGMAAYHKMEQHLAPPDWRTLPLPAFACVSNGAVSPPKIPKLLAAYLSLGAKICGPPALDHQFKTIDFLTFMDLNSVSAKTAARYMS